MVPLKLRKRDLQNTRQSRQIFYSVVCRRISSNQQHTTRDGEHSHTLHIDRFVLSNRKTYDND